MKKKMYNILVEIYKISNFSHTGNCLLLDTKCDKHIYLGSCLIIGVTRLPHGIPNQAKGPNYLAQTQPYTC